MILGDKMRSLWTSLIAISVVTLTHSLIYIFASRWYKNNPEAKKTDLFNLWEHLFKRKYMKTLFIAVGIICFAAAIVVFNVYDLAAV